MASVNQLGPWCSPVNTSPCHGEDHRFKSGRTRQQKSKNSYAKYEFFAGEARKDVPKRRGALASGHPCGPQSLVLSRWRGPMGSHPRPLCRLTLRTAGICFKRRRKHVSHGCGFDGGPKGFGQESLQSHPLPRRCLQKGTDGSRRRPSRCGEEAPTRTSEFRCGHVVVDTSVVSVPETGPFERGIRCP